MGGFSDDRWFMALALFCECFFAALPPEQGEFDSILIDAMQWLAGLVHCKPLHAHGFDTAAVLRRLAEVVAHYLNNEGDAARPRLTTALVVLLDTVHRVPRSKGATQQGRDAAGDAHMDEARFTELCAQGHVEGALFLQGGPGPRYALRGDEVWRSRNLKLQLYAAVATQLQWGCEVAPGRALILDDAPDLGSPDEYAQWRAAQLEAHAWTARSAFDQECLVAQLVERERLQRFIVWGPGEYRAWEPTGSGEADIKILHYINGAGSARRFLVVNQDTDVLFVLLLACERLLHETPDLQLWLDAGPPGDAGRPAAKAKPAKPYRYCNVVALYHAVVALFAREYPGVRHPVETFCFLVQARASDFVPAFGASAPCPTAKRRHAHCLCVRAGDIWDLFSELHSVARDGFIRFSTKRLVRERERYWSSALHGLIASAVTYCWVKRRFVLRHQALRQFFYLLFQRRLMEVRRAMRLPVTLGEQFDFFAADASTRADALPAEELLIYAHDVAERIEAYRRLLQAQERALLEQLRLKREATLQLEEEPAKRFKPATKRGKLLAHVREEERPLCDATTEDEAEEVEEEEAADSKQQLVRSNGAEQTLERYVRTHGDILGELLCFPFSQYHGVPTPDAMLVRLYDLELYLDYCRDGWQRGAAAAAQLVQRARLDPALQVWPYAERVLADGEERARARATAATTRRATTTSATTASTWCRWCARST